MPWASIQAGSVRTRSISSSVCGFSRKPADAPAVVDPHHAQRSGILARHGQRRDRHVGLRLLMRLDHVAIVHAVQLIAGQDQDVVDAGLIEVLEVLPHGVGGSLVPVRPRLHRLLSRQQLDKAAVERVEAVRLPNVPMQADRHELRQHIDAIHAAVDAVRQRNVDQPILRRQRHGRLRAVLGQGIQTGSTTAAEDQSDDIFHARTDP